MNVANGYVALASSIFLIAERDIRKAKKAIVKNPGNKVAQETLEEIGAFLWSDWAGVLEAAAGVEVIEKMKEMIDDK